MSYIVGVILSIESNETNEENEMTSHPEHKTAKYMTHQLNSALTRYTLSFDSKALAHLTALARHWKGETILNGLELFKIQFDEFVDYAFNHGVDVRQIVKGN